LDELQRRVRRTPKEQGYRLLPGKLNLSGKKTL
jgi:hypothetical protein